MHLQVSESPPVYGRVISHDPRAMKRARQDRERAAVGAVPYHQVTHWPGVHVPSVIQLRQELGKEPALLSLHIYALTRQAVVRGHSGIRASTAELGRKFGRCRRTVQRHLEAMGSCRYACPPGECKTPGVYQAAPRKDGETDEAFAKRVATVAKRGLKCADCNRPCPPDCRVHPQLLRRVPRFIEGDTEPCRDGVIRCRRQGRSTLMLGTNGRIPASVFAPRKVTKMSPPDDPSFRPAAKRRTEGRMVGEGQKKGRGRGKECPAGTKIDQARLGAAPVGAVIAALLAADKDTDQDSGPPPRGTGDPRGSGGEGRRKTLAELRPEGMSDAMWRVVWGDAVPPRELS